MNSSTFLINLSLLISIFGFSQNNLPNIVIKDKIVSELYLLNGELNESILEQLITELKNVSHDSSMCFYSLGSYNKCEGNKVDTYQSLSNYLDDLLGQELFINLTKWNKPWDDENFYTLKFIITYVNDNMEFPVEENFDTLILDISDDKIKNIIYAREWIKITEYGN